MSSNLITADNGVSSGVTGITQSAGSDGTLQLRTTSSGGSAVTALTIDNSQKVTFANTIGFGSNAGITFNNSSALTNSTLNDYETGTWSPTATPASGALSGYTSTGTYTKIGRVVYVIGNINITGAGTASGSMLIGGLPFTTLNTTARPAIPLAREDQTTGVIYGGFVGTNATTLTLTSTSGGSLVWSNSYNYSFCFTYQATF